MKRFFLKKKRHEHVGGSQGIFAFDKKAAELEPKRGKIWLT